MLTQSRLAAANRNRHSDPLLSPRGIGSSPPTRPPLLQQHTCPGSIAPTRPLPTISLNRGLSWSPLSGKTQNQSGETGKGAAPSFLPHTAAESPHSLLSYGSELSEVILFLPLNVLGFRSLTLTHSFSVGQMRKWPVFFQGSGEMGREGSHSLLILRANPRLQLVQDNLRG